MALTSLLASVLAAPSWLFVVVLCAVFTSVGIKKHFGLSAIDKPPEGPLKGPDAPVSVNYFPSRKCNYSCGFCFHTETSSYVLPADEAKCGLRLLREAGMRKLNIAGGEPFLFPRLLAELLRYCKAELGVESTSIVSNGSKVTEKWLRENCQWLDILAVSCDSFQPPTNKRIGRGDDGGNVVRLFRVAQWCRAYGVRFKLNTVVNAHNWDEDMVANIEQLAPFRWKVFQCLIVAGENDDETRKRDARAFLVTDQQGEPFATGINTFRAVFPRTTNKGEGVMTKSESILHVGVKEAMKQVVWDKKSFVERGGIYDWGRSDMQQQSVCGGGGSKKELEW